MDSRGKTRDFKENEVPAQWFLGFWSVEVRMLGGTAFCSRVCFCTLMENCQERSLCQCENEDSATQK